MATSPSIPPSRPAAGAPKVDFISDEDLEKDWKPNGRRPQSTIARSFSAELEDIFRIDNSVADLDAKLDQRKQKVQTHASELEALEQRIREMEARLKGNGNKPAPQATIPERRPVPEQQLNASSDTLQATAGEQKHGGSRPGTAKASQQAVPGALPPTPTASEGEYEFVPDPYTTSFGPEYPRYRHQLLLPRMTTSGGGVGVSGVFGGGSNVPAHGTAMLLHQAQQLRSQHYHQPPSHFQNPHQNTLSNNYNHHQLLSVNKPQSLDARSVKSVHTISSESGSADFVIVPGPDGDGEQDH